MQRTFFDASYGWQMLPEIAQGRWLNVPLMVVCEIRSLILAMIVALVRSLRGPAFFPLRAAPTIYADLFRGLALILVLFLPGFGIRR